MSTDPRLGTPDPAVRVHHPTLPSGDIRHTYVRTNLEQYVVPRYHTSKVHAQPRVQWVVTGDSSPVLSVPNTIVLSIVRRSLA